MERKARDDLKPWRWGGSLTGRSFPFDLIRYIVHVLFDDESPLGALGVIKRECESAPKWNRCSFQQVADLVVRKTNRRLAIKTAGALLRTTYLTSPPLGWRVPCAIV
jgi:hypothetical protein